MNFSGQFRFMSQIESIIKSITFNKQVLQFVQHQQINRINNYVRFLHQVRRKKIVFILEGSVQLLQHLPLSEVFVQKASGGGQ